MKARGSERSPGRRFAAEGLKEAARKAWAGVAWGFVLVVFMRLLAVIWVLQGLLQWSAFLLPRVDLFDQVPVSWAASVIFFAVFDIVAAVGLWLASPWGGAIWLFVALAQILVAVTFPGFFSVNWIRADLALIGIYFILTWLAGHPRSRAS